MVENNLLHTPDISPAADQQPANNNNSDNCLHLSSQCALLAFIGNGFREWFTPQEVFDKCGQSSVKAIQDFCFHASISGFFEFVSNGENYKFKANFTFLK